MRYAVIITAGVALAMVLVFGLRPRVTAEPGVRSETKVVLVVGDQSSLLRGDPIYTDAIGPDRTRYGQDVLPKLLAEGWVVDSVNVVQVTSAAVPQAYVVIKR
jgi:hypothetical protein